MKQLYKTFNKLTILQSLYKREIVLALYKLSNYVEQPEQTSQLVL